MTFSKEQFVKENSAFLCEKLVDFMGCEIYEEVYKDIIYLISWPNIRACTYEGNMYAIHKRENNSRILIADEVSLEHGVSPSQAQFEIEATDLLELIEQRAKEHNWD